MGHNPYNYFIKYRSKFNLSLESGLPGNQADWHKCHVNRAICLYNSICAKSQYPYGIKKVNLSYYVCESDTLL